MDVISPEFGKVRVLLVEDNPVGAKVARRLLELLGCEATHAWDGQQAYDAATTGQFDLVLMDMQMPVMDGLQATMKIRAHEAAAGKQHVAIFALTANGTDDDSEMCAGAGMDGHLAKPIEKESLRQLVTRATGSAEAPACADKKLAVDLDKALERCGGDRELLAEVAAACEESFAANSALLHAAARTKDGMAVYRAAHSLKGVFVYVCAEGAAKLAQSLCEAGQQGDMDRIPTLLDALACEYFDVSRLLVGNKPEL